MAPPAAPAALLLVLLPAVALFGLPAVGFAPVASACSCAAASMSLSAPRPPGEVLFEGRVIGGRDVADDRETVWTVEAMRVRRGDVTAVQPVVTPSLSSSCGLELTVGETYLISAEPDARPGVLATGLCTATTPTANLTVEERHTLEQQLGPGAPPRAAPAAPVPDRPDASTRHTTLIVGALAGAGLAATITTLILPRRRRASPPVDNR